jgi:adenosylcobinamide hydrolase
VGGLGRAESVFPPELACHEQPPSDAGQSSGERIDGLAVLVWRFPEPTLVVSSAPLGGGLGRRKWALNAQVPASYDRVDPEVHLAQLAAGLGLPGEGVGMLTAVDVRQVLREEDGGARADVTLGITHPTWAAEDEPTDVAVDGHAPAPVRPGTINAVVFVPEPLSPAALVNMVVTVTEAKTQALSESGLPATGTASDAVCVACPAWGEAHPFGGPRSQWGARVARAVHRAVLSGCVTELGS